MRRMCKPGFRGTREALLFAYSEEWLDDVKFIVLNEFNTLI